MSDPILLFLTVDAVALLLLGATATLWPLAVGGFLATMLSGLGLLLCLPPLLMAPQPTDLTLPFGPPGLSLHFALDPLSAFFLTITFLAATAITAFQATAAPPTSIRTTAFCLAGTILSLLAADAITLTLGLAAIRLPHHGRTARLVPVLILAAIGLLTPPGHAPNFETIRAASIDPTRTTAAAVLTVLAILTWTRSAGRCWNQDALTAGLLIPTSAYLLLRLIADLPGTAVPPWFGFIPLLTGSAIAIIQTWRAAIDPEITTASACLTLRQTGLATAAIGLALIARAADLPAAGSFALAAAFLSVIAAAAAGTLTTLAVHTITISAGTNRLSRLGGLIHAMPATSAALAAGTLALSAIPPGLGFASLWLLFQATLSAPRTGGLLIQLPLALTAGTIALSAALATAASIRMIGIAILGRPRTPRGAGARDLKSPARTILLTLAGVSLLPGLLPGSTLWLLADPTIRILTGTHTGLPWMSPLTIAPGYLALPVLALLALLSGSVLLIARRPVNTAKLAGPWTDGMPPPLHLPFGEPAAQSAGRGFLPTLPTIALPRPPSLPAFRPPKPATGPWLLLAAFAALLLLVTVAG